MTIHPEQVTSSDSDHDAASVSAGEEINQFPHVRPRATFLALCLLTGCSLLSCLNVPELRDLAPLREWVSLNSNEDRDRLTASGESLRIVWDARSGYAPVEISRSDDANLVWSGARSESPEYLAGILFYNHVASHAASAPSVEVLHQGPGVVRLRVSWRAVGTRSNSTMEGDTTWTVHDDGRIFRDERFSVIQSGSTGWVVGYHTVPIERVDSLRWLDDDDSIQAIPKPTRIEEVPFQRAIRNHHMGWLCARGDEGAILFAAYRPAPSYKGLRATWNGLSDGEILSLQLQFDWLWDAEPTVDAWSGVLLTSLHNDCDEAARFEEAHRTPPAVELVSGTWSNWEGGGELDGYYERGGFYTVIPSEDERVALRFEATSAPSMTLWIDSSSEDAPKASVDGVSLPRDLFVASRGEGGWFVHVRRQINTGETLTLQF